MVIAVTGGGSGAISALLAVPGASRTVLAAVVPYASQALVEWLGGRPDEFCSARTARAMAMAAFLKARTYDPQGQTCGVACTASLASDRPKRGPHRAHLAYQTATTTCELSLELEKGRRSRSEEEGVVAATGAQHDRRRQRRASSARCAARRVGTTRKRAKSWRRWSNNGCWPGRCRSIPLGGRARDGAPKAIMPGAFDPLHERSSPDG